jgi:hypothetical protein
MVALVLGALKPALTETEGTTVKAPFTVVNQEGKTLAKIEVDRFGQTRLDLSTKEGSSPFALVLSDHAALLSLASDSKKEGTPGLYLVVKKDQTTVLVNGGEHGMAVLDAKPKKSTLFLGSEEGELVLPKAP